MLKKFLVLSFVAASLFACGKKAEPTVKKEDKISKSREYETEKKVLGPKKRLVISSFTNKSGNKSGVISSGITDVMTTELVKTGRYVLLERQDLDKLMEELQFSSSGLTQGKLSESKLLDADYIITGSITKFASNGSRIEVTVDLRLVDLRTGAIVLADSGEASGEGGDINTAVKSDAFRMSVIKFMENMIKTIDSSEWSAKVVKVSNGNLYLNAGKQSNLELGTLLQVFKQGEAIEDNGIILGYEEDLKGTAKVTGYFGEDGAKAEMVDGSLDSAPAIVKMKK